MAAGGNAELEAHLKALEDQVHDMQEELTALSIKVGIATFMSRTQTKAWLDTTGCPLCGGLFYLDAMLVLALMHRGSKLARAVAEFASVMKTVGYSSPDEALVIMSFSLELPQGLWCSPQLWHCW